MARREPLAVWLYGRHIADVNEHQTFRYTLTFTAAAVEHFGYGSRVLSLALPMRREPYKDSGPDGGVAAFLEGLLPEGNLRRVIAATAVTDRGVKGVAVVDKMGLLRHVGAECAGAVQFLPTGQDPGAGTIRPLSADEVERLIADLPTYALPEGARPSASLAGIQDKVLLTQMPDGTWGWPEGGAASTHLVKPQPTAGALDHLVETEHWALEVANAAGLPAAKATLEYFGNRPAIIVERYDRLRDGSRLHQEDLCQALGLDPGDKYESSTAARASGSRLSQIAHVAADHAESPTAFRSDLLRAVTFNILVGNADAHSKNYSLLLGPDGRVSLAPLYDVAPVMHLNSSYNSIGHIINGRTNIASCTVEDLVAEAGSWGLGPKIATMTVKETFERTYDAVQRIALPAQAAFVRGLIDRAWSGSSWATQWSGRADAVAVTAQPAALSVGLPSSSGEVWVEGYINARGTAVPGHWRKRPLR